MKERRNKSNIINNKERTIFTKYDYIISSNKNKFFGEIYDIKYVTFDMKPRYKIYNNGTKLYCYQYKLDKIIELDFDINKNKNIYITYEGLDIEVLFILSTDVLKAKLEWKCDDILFNFHLERIKNIIVSILFGV